MQATGSGCLRSDGAIGVPERGGSIVQPSADGAIMRRSVTDGVGSEAGRTIKVFASMAFLLLVVLGPPVTVGWVIVHFLRKWW